MAVTEGLQDSNSDNSFWRQVRLDVDAVAPVLGEIGGVFKMVDVGPSIRGLGYVAAGTPDLHVVSNRQMPRRIGPIAVRHG